MLKLAGKIAEELFFGNYSAGCCSDLEQARAFAMRGKHAACGEEEEARTAKHECGHLFCLWYLEEAAAFLEYGGKCAEEIFFGTSSAGCRADMQEARAFAMESSPTTEQRTRDLLDKDDMKTNLKKAIY
uniref:Peptidase_M41 domain-containing protein n=1 Tax=Globodera pallida TaxID=36090 RepID=A0A183C1A4_GLOPA